MGKRREGREVAVQFLFQHDLNSDEVGRLLNDFWELRPASEKVRQFADALVRGVVEQRETVDERIRKYATNYDLHRIAAVDRNILRVAIYEMLFCNDVPPVVAINEAIEVAKRYGNEESGRFINGILDRVKLDLSRPPRLPKSQD